MAGQVIGQITMSLDGYVAGQNDSPANPMGDGGESIHDWVVRLASWRQMNGMEGGETGPDSDLLQEFTSPKGAVILGRRMFDNGFAPWGENPPYHSPVFVVTHRLQAPIEMQGGTTYYFVDGVESALAQARAMAGEGDISIAGGGQIIQQMLRACAIDRLQVHVAPILLGGGVPLFDNGAPYAPGMVVKEIVASPHVAHFMLKRAM